MLFLKISGSYWECLATIKLLFTFSRSSSSWKKFQATFIPSSCSLKIQWKGIECVFPVFSDSLKWITKKENLYGVIFKLSSGSLNTKNISKWTWFFHACKNTWNIHLQYCQRLSLIVNNSPAPLRSKTQWSTLVKLVFKENT